MAFFSCRHFSESLGMQTEAYVIIPQSASPRQIGISSSAPRAEWPCLWLLHGLSDDHTIWTRRTSIERYAEEAGIAVVMPNGQRSFYTDMARGQAFWAYLSEELPLLLRDFFPLSARREDNAVAGLSMGGYGAAKWLLRRTECFLAGASLSGVLDIGARYRMAIHNPEEALRLQTMQLAFGDTDPTGTEEDLLALASRLGQNAPPLLQICGTEDFLYEDNLRFRDHALSCGLPLTYREGPGAHTWGYWDTEIQTVITWLQELSFGAMPSA